MNDGYTKLFGSIVTSTIWSEPHVVRIVWVTMLACANKRGIVESSIPGLAHVARVTIEECETAISVLSSPDKYSRTKDNEGRRIVAIDGGWQLLNHPKYRQKMNVDERRMYLRDKQREHRANNVNTVSTVSTQRNASSTLSTQAEAEAEANAEAEREKTASLPNPVHGQYLTQRFGELRSEIVGGLPWQGAHAKPEKAGRMADEINAVPGSEQDIEPTMRLVLQRAIHDSPRHDARFRKPAFAFGAWCSEFTSLREQVHGLAPAGEAQTPRQDVRVGHFRVEAGQKYGHGEQKI